MKVIYKTVVGSRLYGINLPESDTDVKGLFVPPVEDYFGVNSTKGFETVKISNGEPDGPTKVEGTLHSVRKYFAMACVGNPNLLEVVFADPKYHLVHTHEATEVINFARSCFLTKKIIDSYFKYFSHEIKTIQTKPSEKSKDRRKILYDTYGYDTKAAAHAYRLGYQAIQVLTQGTLAPTLTGKTKEVVMNMRAAKYNKEEALKLITDLYEEMKKSENKTKLPEEPDTVRINEFLINFHLGAYR